LPGARAPQLTVTVAAANRDTPGLSVERDGVKIAAAAWGTALRLDPGSHVVVASAPGKKRWTQTVTLAAAPVTVTVPVLENEASGAPEKASPAADASTAGREAPQQRSVAPWVIGGIGLAGLVAGGILGGLVLHDQSITSGDCNEATHTCRTQNGLSAASQGRTLGPATTVSLVAGGVGVAVGGIWLLARAPAKSPASPATQALRGAPLAALRMGPAWTAGGAEWRLQGSW
jgi:hypothetical protein